MNHSVKALVLVELLEGRLPETGTTQPLVGTGFYSAHHYPNTSR